MYQKRELNYIFKPKSIALIGASKKRGHIGRALLDNLLHYEFNGKVFPVNPSASVIQCMKCFPTVLDIPDPVDLAIVVVRKEFVLQVVEQCGKKGVKGLVIISAGFKETGPKGAALEEQLVNKIRKYGMRMIGPNCMGIFNTHSDVRLHAVFVPYKPMEGRISFMTQSGGLGATILAYAQDLRIGFSMFASVGNKADISGNDLLEYWRDDPETDIILVYLESFGDPRRFTQLTRKIYKKKPIILVKAGRTRAGGRAAYSHTGALFGADVAVDALCEQSGVLRVTSVEEMFDLARALSSQPLPKGNKVAIVTNAGGPGILATDACVGMGLQLASFSEKTKAALKEILPPEASIENPIDQIASADYGSYKKTLELVFRDDNVDCIIVIYVPPLVTNPLEVAKGIVAAKTGSEKPILVCFMGSDETVEGIKELERHSIPVYRFPEAAVKSLVSMIRYGGLKERAEGRPVKFRVNRRKAAAVFEKVREEGRLQLRDDEIKEVLTAYGIPFAKTEVVKLPGEAIAAAERIGYPVALKIQSADIAHKSDIGGVMVDLRNEGELKTAYSKIFANLKAMDKEKEIQGIIVQEMVKNGKEVIFGMNTDPIFGPLIAFGLGGIYVETMRDIVFRIHPITDRDAQEMISSVRSYRYLRGVRGEKSVDLDVLAECLERLSQLISDFDEIDQLDVNPFIAGERREDCRAVDAVMMLRS